MKKNKTTLDDVRRACREINHTEYINTANVLNWMYMHLKPVSVKTVQSKLNQLNKEDFLRLVSVTGNGKNLYEIRGKENE